MPLEPDSESDVPSPALPDDGFGKGDLPENLRRFNWGAFFLPFFWGVAYRSWPVLAAWFVAVTSPMLIIAMTGATRGGRLSVVLGVSVASEIVAGLCRLWAGLNANSGLWRRDALLREMLPAYQSRLTIDRFTARQRIWTIVGAVVALLSAALIAPFEASVWREYGLAYIGGAMPIVWLVAEILLGLWLDDRIRKEPPDVEKSAQNLV